MKYFKDELGAVWAYESDGSQDHLIPETFIPFTEEETQRHENPDKFLTPEEQEAKRLASFPSITRRQFKLTLLENGLLETVEAAIAAISDPTTKMRIQIEYLESERFERDNPSIGYMLTTLGLSVEQVDAMWKYAMTL